MTTGAITGYIDVAQLVLYVFWIFFIGLVIYLRREDKREGYPLEAEGSSRKEKKSKRKGTRKLSGYMKFAKEERSRVMEENPKMRLSIYQTDLQYALMKCIQEQQALITSLTARVALLEGN